LDKKIKNILRKNYQLQKINKNSKINKNNGNNKEIY